MDLEIKDQYGFLQLFKDCKVRGEWSGAIELRGLNVLVRKADLFPVEFRTNVKITSGRVRFIAKRLGLIIALSMNAVTASKVNKAKSLIKVKKSRKVKKYPAIEFNSVSLYEAPRILLVIMHMAITKCA